jgi:PRTRC genetic system protein C
MSISANPIKRVFAYNGMQLPEVDAALSTEEVRDVYSAQFAELTTAEVTDEGIANGVHTFSFRRKVGEKGARQDPTLPRVAATSRDCACAGRKRSAAGGVGPIGGR